MEKGTRFPPERRKGGEGGRVTWCGLWGTDSEAPIGAGAVAFCYLWTPMSTGGRYKREVRRRLTATISYHIMRVSGRIQVSVS